MTDLPDNLVPIPTQPWDTRPISLPLDREEVRTAIWLNNGVILNAAKTLKIDSGRLRRFIANSEYLQREIQEAKEQLVDIAEENVRDALEDGEDPGRRDQMTRFVLQTQGKHRGWGNGAGKVEVNNNGGTMVFQWADGTSVTPPSKLIEGEVVDV